MKLPDDLDAARLTRLIAMAREEDMGSRGDITSRVFGPSADSVARIVARQPCVVAGMAIVPHVLRAYDPSLSLEGSIIEDGTVMGTPGRILGELCGPSDHLLSCERVMLNFLQRMSGVATLSRKFVDAVAGTNARIFDTRKTIPGWRDLDKYAVRCGGGHNHRAGLYDAILLKDNHLSGIDTNELGRAVKEMLKRALDLSPAPRFVEVEVDTLDQLDAILPIDGIDVILLDNFSREDMCEAVARRDALGLGSRLKLESSGGIDLSTVRGVAETGIDRIAIGALTHSAPAVDIALERIA